MSITWGRRIDVKPCEKQNVKKRFIKKSNHNIHEKFLEEKSYDYSGVGGIARSDSCNLNVVAISIGENRTLNLPITLPVNHPQSDLN